MRDYTGVAPSTLPPPDAPNFQNRLRSMIFDIDYFLRDLNRGIARIQVGEVPDGSGNQIGSGGVLTDYFYLPGRSSGLNGASGQVGHGSTISGGTLTLHSTSHDTKGNIFFGDAAAFDEANTRLGIGTTSPQAPIHLDQPTDVSYTRPNNTSGGVGSWRGQDGGSTNLQAYVNESTLDESTYVTEATGAVGTNIKWVLWTAGNIPFSGSPSISLTFRIRRDPTRGNAGTEFLQFTLYRAATTVTTQASATSFTTAWADYTYTLTAGEVSTLFGSGADGSTMDMSAGGVGGPGGYDVAQVTMTIGAQATGDLMRWDTASTQTGRITVDGYLESRRLMLLGTTSGTITLTGGAAPTSHSYVLPTAQGAASTLLQNDGSGNLSWVTGASIVDVARTWSTLQTFKDTTFKLVDDADASKTAVFSLGGASANADLTLAWAGTGDRTVTLPDATGTIPTIQNAATITGAWILGNAGQAIIAATDPGTSTYTGLGFILSDPGSGFNCQLGFGALGLTADRICILPDADAVLVGTTATQNITNKTLQSTGNLLKCINASTGVAFSDNSTASKQLRMILSGAVGNNSITLSNTAARDYQLPDYSASAVLVGNTTSAAGVLGASDLTAQTGSIGATTLLTSSANSSGLFRVSFYLETTTAGSGGDVVKVTVAFNNGSAQTADVLLQNLVATPGAMAINHDLSVLNNASCGSVVVKAAASTAITFTTTVTIAGSPQYTISARIEALG